MSRVAKNLNSIVSAVRRGVLMFATKTTSLAALVALLAVSAQAGAGTTFNYQGNPYMDLGGTYASGGPYALSIEFTTSLSGSALDNLPLTDIAPTVSSFSFTDGSGLTFNSTNRPPSQLHIEIGTNASGDVDAWFLGAYDSSGNVQMQTNSPNTPYGFTIGGDFSETTANFAGSYGFVAGNPGTWSEVASPEPASIGLLGVVGIGLLSLRRCRRTVRRTACDYSVVCAGLAAATVAGAAGMARASNVAVANYLVEDPALADGTCRATRSASGAAKR